MTKRQKMFAVLPTLLTLGNAASGFGSITFAAKVGPEQADGNHLLVAAVLIFLAMLFDMLDGSAARWAKQTSDFGAQLDSLCDTISCGIAPAFLMLQFSRESNYHPRLIWTIAALFVVCAVLRLARFNVETDEDDSHEFFSGLPSPAAAGAIASFPIAMRGLNDWSNPHRMQLLQDIAAWMIPALQMSLPILTLVLACLMVSRFRYSHVFNQWIRGRRSRHHVIQLVFMGVVVCVAYEFVIPAVFIVFALGAPTRALWSEFVAPRLHKSQEV